MDDSGDGVVGRFWNGNGECLNLEDVADEPVRQLGVALQNWVLVGFAVFTAVVFG